MVSLAMSTVTAPRSASASAAWLESVLRVFEPSLPAAVDGSVGGLEQGRTAAIDYIRRAGPPNTRQEA